MTIPAAIQSSDWEQVFGAAGEKPGDAWTTIYNPGSPMPAVPPGDPRFHDAQPPFTREDVVRVVALHEDPGDEWSGVAVVELRDGRFGYVSGGCDYTGWD